jgi:type IV pilus assembly protein PilM
MSKTVKSGMIGIDVRNDRVLMAQVKGSSAVLAVERLPENLIRNGQIVSPELLAKFLKQMRKAHKFSGSSCVLVLPSRDTYFRTASMPRVTEQQLLLNLPYEFRDYIGTEGAYYNYDYAINTAAMEEKSADEDDDSLELFIAASNKQLIADYGNILRRAGLNMKAAIPREMALINLMVAANAIAPSVQEYCLVEFGYDHTRINIAKGGALAATKTIDFGLSQFDSAIAFAYNIDLFVASSYRETNYEDVLNSSACQGVCDQIGLEITKAINFYKYENPDSEISSIIFCGIGSDERAIVDAISDYVGLPERSINEIVPACCASNENTSRCAAAIGASL